MKLIIKRSCKLGLDKERREIKTTVIGKLAAQINSQIIFRLSSLWDKRYYSG